MPSSRHTFEVTDETGDTVELVDTSDGRVHISVAERAVYLTLDDVVDLRNALTAVEMRARVKQ